MKRLVVKWKDEFANVAADRIEARDGMVYAYAGSELVGVFCLGIVDIIYLSKGESK